MSKYLEPNYVEEAKHVSASSSEVTEWEARAKKEGIKPAFLAKVEVLNEAIRDIGMGRFQYELFITAGT